MDWKEKMKWKILIILAALAGILIVWCAGRAGEKNDTAESEILREYALKENEWASAQSLISSFQDSFMQAEEASETEQADEEAEQEKMIRVLIMDQGYKSYYHNHIRMEFQGSFEGSSGEMYETGDVLELTQDSGQLTGENFILSPTEENARIKVSSLSRGQGAPSYRGSLTVYKDEKGLRLINTLPLEEYLWAVVPSEMPSSYPEEALKAQAVCARTYACVQMINSSLEYLGAQVDDSVSYQVYQNSGEAEETIRAVEETSGEILLNHGSPINAYYFSTSHGKTSTDQVWAASVPSSYLRSVECTFDSGEPWYQWEVEISLAKILANFQGMFGGLSSVTGIETGEENAGEGLTITRQDGSQVMGSSLLPSAYFTLEEKKDRQGNLTGYLIRGGGYGHGVGMSQNGAKGMAEAGKDYREILSYFYKDVEIGNIKDVVNIGDS